MDYQFTRYYYTDEAYEAGQAIVSEYTDRIKAASSIDEAKALEDEAVSKLSAVPHSSTPI